MEKCLWIESCPFKEECFNCNCLDEKEDEYISRELFYKDWFNYIERWAED